MSLSDLANAKGFWHPSRNIVGWLVTPSGQSGQGARSWVLVYNYGLSDPVPGGKKYWSIWKLPYGLTCATPILNPSGGFQSAKAGEIHLYFGSDRGLVYQGDYASLDDDGTAYTATVQTPILTRFPITSDTTIPETQEKSFVGVTTYVNSEIASLIQFTAVVDGRTQSDSFTTAAGGDVLG
jgi:hypothetical protein